MPPLPYSPGLIKVNVQFFNDGANWYNHFHWQVTDEATPSLTDLTTLATDIRAAFAAHIPAFMDDAYGLAEVETVDLSSDSGSFAVVTGDTPGTAGGDQPPPPSVCFCLIEEISRKYRGGRPRMYFTGFDLANLDASMRYWNSSFTTELMTGFNDVFTAVNAIVLGGAGAGYWCAPSYYLAKALRDAPLIQRVNALDFQPRVCSQRRRLGRASPDLP